MLFLYFSVQKNYKLLKSRKTIQQVLNVEEENLSVGKMSLTIDPNVSERITASVWRISEHITGSVQPVSVNASQRRSDLCQWTHHSVCPTCVGEHWFLDTSQYQGVRPSCLWCRDPQVLGGLAHLSLVFGPSGIRGLDSVVSIVGTLFVAGLVPVFHWSFHHEVLSEDTPGRFLLWTRSLYNNQTISWLQAAHNHTLLDSTCFFD